MLKFENSQEKIFVEESAELHGLLHSRQPKPQIHSHIDSKPPPDPRPTFMKYPIRVSSKSTQKFEYFGLETNVVKALQEKGFHEAFAIQSAVLPLLQTGVGRDTGDVIISASTGSGKTLAYTIPLIQDVARYKVSKLRGLIILPTRELVFQIKEVAEICSSAFSKDSVYRNIKIGISAGNEAFKKEQTDLIEHFERYDPKGYKEQVLRAELPWQNFNDNNGGIQNIFEEVVFPRLPGFIDEYKTKVDVLICTPGRLVEHIKLSPGFSLKDIRWLVIDEADKIFGQSYQGCLPLVLSEIESRNSDILARRRYVRKVIVSATMTKNYCNLAKLKLHRPSLVLLEGESTVCDKSRDITDIHVLPPCLKEYSVKVEDDAIKPLYLIELLKKQKIIVNTSVSGEDNSPGRSSTPNLSSDLDHEQSHLESVEGLDAGSDAESDRESFSDSTSGSESECGSISSPHPDLVPRFPILPNDNDDASLHGVLIFTKSNETAARLARLIALLSPSLSSAIGVLTSTLPRISRQNYLNLFAKKKLSILVASDLVSRGLDLPILAHVINYDVPNSCITYIHRVGRTARAGRLGYAWSLVTNSESHWFWKEIGSASNIHRAQGEIRKRLFKGVDTNEQRRKAYLLALEKLEKEVSESIK